MFIRKSVESDGKRLHTKMSAVLQFFVNLKDARWGILGIVDFFKGIFRAVKADADIVALWEKGLNAISPVLAYLPYILLALCLVEAFFGKRLLNLQKFLACFIIGFACGVHYLAPFVDKVFVMPSWITGLVVGLVGAVFCKVIYVLAAAIAAGYATYVIAYTGSVLPTVTNFTKGNLLFSIIAAAVALILVFILLKVLEMLGTSFLGSWGAVKCINIAIGFMNWYWLAGKTGVIVYWSVIGVITLATFLVQWKTRKRF